METTKKYQKTKTKKAPKVETREASEAEKLQKIGQNAMASIKEMVDALNVADSHTDEYEKARQVIEEDPLSIEVRSDWRAPTEGGDESPAEYRILLGTGGPAVRLVGELDRGEPTTARLEVQDWFQPWTEYRESNESVLLSYVQWFYFGEG